jgi:hypothetical protein
MDPRARFIAADLEARECVDVPVAHAAKWEELADTGLRLRKENS